jgi:hypothetical protein
MVEPSASDRGGQRDRVSSRLDRTAPIATIAWLLVCATARAQEPSFVSLAHCPPELAATVPSAIEVELSSASDDARSALTLGELRCELECTDANVRVAVIRGERRLDALVATSGASLPRRVAIVVAELVDAIAAPDVSPPAPPIVDDPAPSATVEVLRARLRASGGAWVGGAPIVALGTFDLGIELAPSTNVAIVIDAAGAIGATSVPDARLDVRLVSAAASLRLGGNVDWLWIGGGPAARGGLVSWTGHAIDATAVGADASGGWLGLGAVLAVFARIGSTPVRVGVELEGGGIAVYSGAVVLDVVAQQIGSGWLETRLAIDVALDGANS